MSNNGVLDDTNPLIRYEPDGAWQLDTSLGVYGPYNGTLHGTTQSNAKATFQFTGTSVSVTCLLYPTGANFTATLDNVVVGSYNTAVTSLSDAQTKVIFTKDGLDSSAQHTLVLQKTANDPGWVSSVVGDAASHLNLDSITIVNGNGQATPSSPTPSPSSSSLPPSAIAGIVIGALAVIFLLIGGFWYRRRRAKNSSRITDHTPFANSTSQTAETKPVLAESPGSPKTAAAASPVRSAAHSGRREKVGLPFTSQNEGPGDNSRRVWRSSLFELPGHRVVRVQSRAPPPRTDSGEGSGDTTLNSGVERAPAGGAARTSPTPPLSFDHDSRTRATVSRQQQARGGSTRVDETVFSSVSGPESHITESSHPASTVPSPPPMPEQALSSPSSSPNRDIPSEKALFQGPNSGTGSSIPMTASTIPPASVSPSSSNASGGANTNILLQEVAALRDQVRQLTELHRGGGATYSEGGRSDYEPPPEYVGRDRDSDDESDP